MKKTLTILGSTGTIGKNTLDVVRRNAGRFRIFALTARRDLEELDRQVREFSPECVVLSDPSAYREACRRYGNKPRVLEGEEGLRHAASADPVDCVMAGIVGAAGLEPFIAALESGKRIGLANKEVLVMAGEWLHHAYGPRFLEQIVPVDSEHSAVFQCLEGRSAHEIERIFLTASGGPFRNHRNFENLSVEDALAHPNWDMGNKISIDSATLMNKGLELMEAFWLFPVKLDQISVVIHPQSIIHSMVCFRDGALLAHLGIADMRVPIQYALSYPERFSNRLPRLDFSELKQLTFEEPDFERFPCLGMAVEALSRGGFFPAALNAANEAVVNAFLERRIGFTRIAECIRAVLDRFSMDRPLTLENLKAADEWARKEAHAWISERG